MVLGNFSHEVKGLITGWLLVYKRLWGCDQYKLCYVISPMMEVNLWRPFGPRVFFGKVIAHLVNGGPFNSYF